MALKSFNFLPDADAALQRLVKRINAVSQAEVLTKAIAVLDYMTSGCGDVFTRRSADQDVVCYRAYRGDHIEELLTFTSEDKDGGSRR
jgi:hypothetical protein